METTKLHVIQYGRQTGFGDNFGIEPPVMGWINVKETPKTYRVQAGGEVNIYCSVINKDDLGYMRMGGYIVTTTKEQGIDIWNKLMRKYLNEAREKYERELIKYTTSMIY